MSTLSITKTSDATAVGPISITKTSDATVWSANFLSIASNAIVGFPVAHVITITSDAVIGGQNSPNPPNPQPNNPTGIVGQCETRSLCQDPANPIANFSAESPDPDTFIGYGYGSSSYPPLGSDFSNTGCSTTCVSTISQADADLCAQKLAFLCQYTNPATGLPFSGTNISANTPQSATINCPDGTPFTYTVASGQFLAINQSSANQQALSYAKKMAGAHMICISGLPTNLALNSPVNQTVTATGNLAPPPQFNYWQFSGNLPTGLAFNGGFLASSEPPTITGTPTQLGTFIFSITVTNPGGDYMTKYFSVNVTQSTVTPDILSGAVSYFNLNAPAGNYKVSYVNGALKYSPAAGWSLNDEAMFGGQYRIYYTSAEGTTVPIAFPGTTTQYSSQALVEAANAGKSVQFTHYGGSIGCYLFDTIYNDNVPGSPNPTFQLTGPL